MDPRRVTPPSKVGAARSRDFGDGVGRKGTIGVWRRVASRVSQEVERSAGFGSAFNSLGSVGCDRVPRHHVRPPMYPSHTRFRRGNARVPEPDAVRSTHREGRTRVAVETRNTCSGQSELLRRPDGRSGAWMRPDGRQTGDMALRFRARPLLQRHTTGTERSVRARRSRSGSRCTTYLCRPKSTRRIFDRRRLFG